MDLIEKGADYSKLKKSFVIFICTFDFFEKNGYIYTFENRCVEYPDLRLGDDAIKVFVNVNGKDDSHISSELKELLTYIRNSKIPEKCANPLINNMDAALHKARSNEEWRKEYMILETMRTDYIEKGREEGLELGEERYNKLLKILLDKNDYTTLKKVTVDPDFRQKMFEHYGL